MYSLCTYHMYKSTIQIQSMCQQRSFWNLHCSHNENSRFVYASNHLFLLFFIFDSISKAIITTKATNKTAVIKNRNCPSSSKAMYTSFTSKSTRTSNQEETSDSTKPHTTCHAKSHQDVDSNNLTFLAQQSQMSIYKNEDNFLFLVTNFLLQISNIHE